MTTELSLPLRQTPLGEHNGKPLLVISNLDPANHDDKIVLAGAMLGYQSITDYPNVPQPIVNIILWDSVEESKQGGELTAIRRTGFIRKDGLCLATTSGEMEAKITSVVRLFGPPPWDRPLWMMFGVGTSRTTGNTYHWFRIVPTPPGMD